MTAQRRYVFLGCVTLSALLLAAIAPNFRRGAASLAHPDPVGPTAYSKSAIGHAAFYHLLGEAGIPAEISELGSGRHVGGSDLLVIAEPRSADSTLTEVKAMLTARNVLLVLPKRGGKPDPDKPYWLASDTLLPDDQIAPVLRLADPEATLERNAPLGSLSADASIAGVPAIHQPQLIRSKKLRPLVDAQGGILIGELRAGGRRLVVLSDPDLIANHGLARGDNASIMVRFIRSLYDNKEDGAVIFDEFVHGFSPKPFHMLGILFQFPFVLVTLQMGLGVALLIWSANGRFGAPAGLVPPLEAGKRSLIDTGARLLAQTGRIPELSERYYEVAVRDAGLRLRAPRGLDTPALLVWLGQNPGAPSAPAAEAPPQAVWTWKKELLGESRPHAEVD
jgi:hypothetical protein